MIVRSNTLDYLFLQEGVQGPPGTPGANGQTMYTHIKYSQNANGSSMTDDPTGAKYIGISYNNASATESNDPTDYEWSLIKGADGITIILSNENISFSVDGSNNPVSNQSFSCTVSVFIGTAPKSNFTIGTNTNIPAGLSVSVVDKTVTVSASTANPITNNTGQITIPLTIDGVSYSKVISYSLSKKGETGATGPQGTGVSTVVPQYYVSSSSTQLIGGSWSETEPEVQAGSYIWKRLKTTLTTGSVTYSDAICDVTISGVVSRVDSVNQSITNKVWQTDITSSINSYDGSTASSMRDRISATETGISGITSTVSDLTTRVAGDETQIALNKTTAEQAADHFTWLVASGDSSSNFTLTDRTATLVSDYINLHGTVTFSALNPAAQAVVNTAGEKATVGLGMKVNYSGFNTAEAGECYIHGYTDGVAADVNGYVYWGNKKITVAKTMINPNTVVPYWATVYIVLRLSSASATTGTLYMVWYDSGWKYAVTPTPSAVGGTWTWTETTDIVLGQFIEASNEGQIVNAFLYNPVRNASQVQTSGLNGYQYSSSAVNWTNTHGTNMTNALSMIKKWTNNAVSDTTTIQGGWIATNTITSLQLATDAITSNNFVASSDATSPYSVTGTFLDLSNGRIYSPNFGIDSSGAAYFNGTVNAAAGKIGNSQSYWNIEAVYDYNAIEHIALVANGDAYIQTGNWQVSNNSVATRKYTSSANSAATVSYYKDNSSNTFYDVGMKIPSNFAATASGDNNVTRYNKAFFYGRKYTGNSIPTLDSEWDYFYVIDNSGTLYVKNIIVTSGNNSTFLPTTGGTISGNLSVNGTITGTLSGTATQVGHTLLINGKTFTGVSDVNVGVIGAAFGGTGQDTLNKSANTLINALGAGSATTLNDNVQFITQDTNTANTIYYRRTMSVLWSYIKSKIEAAPLSYASIDTTELTAGNLIVSGAGRFGNGLFGNLTGNVTGTASHASKVYDTDGVHEITFRYSGAGVSSATWFPAWSGYNIVPISADNTRAAISAMYYPKLTSAVTTDSLTTEGLYRIQFPHTGDTTYPTGHYGDLFVSNHGTAYQIWIPDNSTQVWKRIYNNSNNTWGAWSNSWDITASRATFAEAADKVTSRNLTIGNTTKAVKWDTAVSFSKSEISAEATTTTNGWLSAADKTKIDKLYIDPNTNVIGIKGIQSGAGINVSVNSSGIYTVAALVSNPLPASGGTMTGELLMQNRNITIYRESSTSDNIPAALNFRVKDTTTGYTFSDAAIRVFHDHNSSTSYGSNMVVNCAGNLFLGGGEAAENVYRASYTMNQSENLFLLSDGVIYIEGYCQDNKGANRKGMMVNTDASHHEFLPSLASTATNNVGSIGNASYKWANMYATTFHGALDGNASTATVANRLPGFSTGASPSSNITWGNQTGTAVYSSSTSDNCAFYFRKNNPSTGQLSLLVDGVFYQREGAYMCLDTGNYSSYALPLSGGTITGALTVNGVTTHKNEIIIQKATASTNAYNSDNPRITFKNSDSSQIGQLVWSDYDSIAQPSSLTLTGNQNGVNGGEYFIAPNIRANTRLELNSGAYMQYVANTKSINFVFR